MAITYPRELPPGIVFKSSRFGLNVNQSVFTSEISRKIQVQQHAAGATDRWEGIFTTPHLSAVQHRALTAWLVSLRGREGTILIPDPDRKVPFGLPGASVPLVKGASQTGVALITDVWDISTNGLLLPGDRFQLAGINQYFELTERVDSDGSGDSTLAFEPALRTSPADNAPLTIQTPKLLARLTSNVSAWETDHTKSGPITFAWEEVV